MRRTTRSLPGVIGVALLAAAAGQGKQLDSLSEVTVCLHHSIVATPGAIERAKLVARNMFSSIGINLLWRTNPVSEESPFINVDLSGEEPGADGPGPLAEAYPFAGPTGHIVIRYDRVHNAAGVSRDLEPLILAHVLVHEITHILQCLDRHSETGIMKAHWSAEDYYDMRWKPLTFTPEDIELIRLGMQVLRSRGDHPEAIRAQHGQ